MSEFLESPAGGTYVRPDGIDAVAADGNQVFVELRGGGRLLWAAHKDQEAARAAAAALVGQIGPPHDSKVVRQTSSRETRK